MTQHHTSADAEPDIRKETATDTSPDESWWATTWPIRKPEWIRLAIALVSVVVVSVVIGEVLTNWSVLDGIVQADQDVARDLADGRTDLQNDLAHWTATISDTPVKIVLSILIAGAFLWRWRRWHEAVMIGLPLIFEALAFIITTYIVQRPRPDVERLLESPVDTSFPSGHVAAATVYGALVVIAFWHTRSVWARTAAISVSAVVALGVAWARAYQGMHFVSDVLAGIVLGLVSIVVCARILGPPPGASTRQSVATGTIRSTNESRTDLDAEVTS